MQDENDYSSSGFDKLLSRGDTPNLQGSLDEETINNRSVPFDRTQVSGPLGDVLKIGDILLDGAKGRIIMNDGNTDILLIGNDSS